MKRTKPLPIITLTSITIILAYVQRHLCPWLPKKGASSEYLQTMSYWLNDPSPRLRTVRNHPYLAAHLAILLKTDLVKIVDNKLTPQPDVNHWLFACHQQQIHRILESFTPAECWQEHLVQLGWQSTLPDDLMAYWQQHLRNQMETSAMSDQPIIQIEFRENQDSWQLCIPEPLPLPVLFDLLQIGEWEPGCPLVCTPMTIAQAARRGISYQFLIWLLESASGEPLDDCLKEHLKEWIGRSVIYRLQNVYLLRTKQPHQLSQILTHRYLKAFVQEQIGPRHALVSPDIAAPLSRFLSKSDYLLDHPEGRSESNGRLEDIENLWLSTRVLVGLRGLLPVSAIPPNLTLSELTGRLTPLKLEQLEHQAQSILEEVSSAIRGRDAFFPACTPVPRRTINLVTEAIEHETTLEITYQSLVDYQPRPRCVSPLRLEQKGTLYYLHAYCYQAERNLTFRLDRVYALQPGDSAELNDLD